MIQCKARFVYSNDYYCDIGDHVFRTDKYGLLHDRLVQDGLVEPDAFLEPIPAAREDLELVHTHEYVDDLKGHRHTHRTMRSEMPISRGIIEAFSLGAGGTILAARTALTEHTMTMNLAGGFHHAFADWAEGFCYINDVAVGVARVRADQLVQRVMVVDCDLHQGNGTAHIFRNEPHVFTFSIHQENNYPVKRHSDLDIGLPDLCPASLYLAELEDNLLPALDQFQPGFVLFVAGADPYKDDLLGSLQLELEDLKRRDEIVIGACADRAIPVGAVLAGGYAPTLSETVQVHYQTAEILCEQAPRLERSHE
ncbi:MAG: histone deacetylase [Planctomycetes bacterium]|nr:histone deacetylase [Planctomycetota bacterium]